MQRTKTKEYRNGKMTLARYLINLADTENYRAGKLAGMKHPKVDSKMIEAVGGVRELIRQADELEKAGLIRTEKENLGADIKKLDYHVDMIPKLCEREGVEDARKRQLRYIGYVKERREEVKDTCFVSYYDRILERLESGKEVKEPNLEDKSFFECLNMLSRIREPVWQRVYSSAVLHDSKKFKDEYADKVISALRECSPFCEDGMTDEEILKNHGILTGSQTIEWKGPVRCEVYRDGDADVRTVLDTTGMYYGTVLNSQTMEHAVPVAMPGVRRVLVIENKTNYDNMEYREDTLYLYCHGFYSPKEKQFLKQLLYVENPGTEYFHWGDMDLGGIRIFQFNRKNIFPGLKPYKMDRAAFYEALRKGAGIPLDKSGKTKRIALEKLDAGLLEELKESILESGMEIEQEVLLAHEWLETL